MARRVVHFVQRERQPVIETITYTAVALLQTLAGVFFAACGWNKLTDPGRKASLAATLAADGLPCTPFMVTWVAGWEFASGVVAQTALVLWYVGLWYIPTAAMLPMVVILVVALNCECCDRVEALRPINRVDYVADLLYLPEALWLIITALCLVLPVLCYLAW